MGIKGMATPVIRDSKTARNSNLETLFQNYAPDTDDDCANKRFVGVDVSVNIVRAVVTSPNSIAQFFAKPTQPLPEIVDKVIASLEGLFKND